MENSLPEFPWKGPSPPLTVLDSVVPHPTDKMDLKEVEEVVIVFHPESS